MTEQMAASRTSRNTVSASNPSRVGQQPDAAGRVDLRLSPAGGVEIAGIDLAQALSPAAKATILRAFVDHHVVVFRGQALTKDQQHALTLNFGELEDHVGRHADGTRYHVVHAVTNLDRDGNPTGNPDTRGNSFWHTDKSYHEAPSLLTMLHAVELPPAGGDTQFANMAQGYAALPEAMKQRIAGLRVVHSWESSRLNSGSRPASEDEKRERPPVVHPLVRTHPDSFAKTVYLGLHASHIEGMPYAEGRALLGELLEHATQPQFVYAHRWRQGDFVIWDNRCLLHRAIANYEMTQHRRVLHRTVIRGPAPV